MSRFMNLKAGLSETVLETNIEARRAALVWNGLPLLTPLTGVGQYTAQVLRVLKSFSGCAPFHQEAYDVDVFLGRSWRSARNLADETTLNSGIGWSIPQTSSRKLKFWRQFLSKVPGARGYARRRQENLFRSGCQLHRPELYHEPNFIAFPFDGLKVVTVHDLSFIRYPETHPAERVRFMDNHIQRSLEDADRIVVVSEFVREELREVFSRSIAEKVTVIPNGVSKDFHPRPTEACAAFLASVGLEFRQFILSVGTLEPRKNLVSLIRAYVRLPTALKKRFPLVIVGMKGWRTDRLEKELDLYRHEAIRWLGFVDQPNLPFLYSSARVFVYPSVYEGFGLPVAEAMASGTPVICSQAAALVEVLGDSGVAVAVDEANALTGGIQRVLEDDLQTQRMIDAGLLRATQFTWERSAHRHAEVYRQLLATGRAEHAPSQSPAD